MLNHAANFKDRTGERHGMITVLGFAGSPPPKYNATWKCRCDCGKETIVVGHKLGKDTNGCGCSRLRRTSEAKRTHGDSKHGKLYALWNAIKMRCRSNSEHAHNYFNRGISVFDEWAVDYVAFKKWIIANIGNIPGPEYSLDRINNELGYFPGNVRWATKSEQARNTRYTIRASYRGTVMPLIDICEKLGKNFNLVKSRVRAGWNIDDALTLPKGTWRYGVRKNIHVINI